MSGSEALMVIDMQNAFLDPGGSVAKQGADVVELRRAVPGCVELIEAARAAPLPVIHVRTPLRPVYRDGRFVFDWINRENRTAARLVGGAEELEFVAGLCPEAGEFVVETLRFSAFHGTSLEALLESLAVDSLVLAGVTANVCVESTARDAAQRNLRTAVVTDATAEVARDPHDRTLATLAAAFCEVAPRADVMRRWASRQTSPI